MIDKTRLHNEVVSVICANIEKAEKQIIKELNEMDIYVKNVELRDIDARFFFDDDFYKKIGNLK